MRQPVVVILGLGRGVGKACARTFCEQKWSVLVADPDGARIEKARGELPDDVELLHENVFTKLGMHNCLAAAREAFDGVDFVLIIPPVPAPSNLMDVDMDTVSAALKESVQTSILAAQIFAPAMQAQRESERDNGSDRICSRGFLQILAYSAVSSDPDRGTETVAQGAALTAMKALSLDLAPQKLRFNSLVALRPRAEDEESWLKSRTPMKRAALADEIAETATFLAGPSSGIITGQSIVLDGGRSMLNGIV